MTMGIHIGVDAREVINARKEIESVNGLLRGLDEGKESKRVRPTEFKFYALLFLS